MKKFLGFLFVSVFENFWYQFLYDDYLRLYKCFVTYFLFLYQLDF